MKDKSGIFEDLDEYINEEREKLNNIYEDLLENNQNKNAIKKFDRIVKSKLDYRGLLPCSKSYEGENLLTISKTWMILILLKITKGKSQQNQFLTLVNSSLTHNLDEYEEYKEFFEDQCDILFSEEEAIKLINLNPKVPEKLDIGIDQTELRNYYIYLLYRPHFFQKINLEGLSKTKNKSLGKNNQKASRNSLKTTKNQSKIDRKKKKKRIEII